MTRRTIVLLGFVAKIALTTGLVSLSVLFILAIALIFDVDKARALFSLRIPLSATIVTSQDNIVPDSTYNVTFRLYQDETGGTPIWGETQTVVTSNGVFQTFLGTINSLSDVDFNQTLYLGLQIGGDSEMSPRKRVGVSPQAMIARTATRLQPASSGESIQAVGSLSVRGSISTTGAAAIGGNVAVTGNITSTGSLTTTGSASIAGVAINSTALQPASNFTLGSASRTLTLSGSSITLSSPTTVNANTVINGSLTASSLTVNGIATLGTEGQNITLNSSLIPSSGGLNLGSAEHPWSSAYIDNLHIDSVDTTGTTGQYFVVNSDAGADENAGIRFYLGSGLNTYSTLKWDGTADKFVLYSNEGTTTLATLEIGGLDVGSLNGILKASGGVVSGSATADDLADGATNQFYTNEKVDDRASALIQNGTGLSWSYNDVANTLTGNISISSFDTDDLAEGTGSLYFTNERTDDRVSALVQNGTGLAWTYDDNANTITGNVSLAAFTTANLAENTNLYFTNERAQAAISETIAGIGYASGVFSLDAGYVIPGTNDVLPSQGGNNGKFLTTNATSPSWVTIDKTTVGLSNVENTALSTWSGSSAITTLGTIVTGTWSGTAIDSTHGGTGLDTHLATGVPIINSGTWSVSPSLPVTLGGTGATDATNARSNLGLAICSNVQAYDSDLGALAGLSTTGLIIRTGDGTAVTRSITGTSNQINVSNGDGAGGNIGLSLPQDIHTGASPTFAGLTVDTNTLYIDAANNRLGVGTNAPSEALTLAGGNLLQTAMNPVHKGSIVDNGTTELSGAINTYVVGRYAYVASTEDDGVEILDISNPASPTHVGAITDDGTTELDGANSIYVQGKYAYIASFEDDGVEILDISNPASPTHVGAITDDGTTELNGANSIYVQGKYAYIASYHDNGVEILDISNPAAPTHVGAITDDETTELDGANSIYVQGKYAYIAGFLDNGVEILDISNPAAPTHVGAITDDETTLLSGANFIQVSGKHAYVASWTGSGVEILDISNPATPTHVGNIADDESTFLASPASLNIAGRYAYVASDADSGIEVIDISDPANPTHVGRIADDGTTTLNGAYHVNVSGKYAYVAGRGENGLEILDISGIDSPAANIGAIATNTINISESGFVFGNFSINGGLAIGSGGILSDGAISQTSSTALNFIAGKIGLGTTAPAAILHLKAGTATAGTAPLKFTAGTNLGTAEAGVMEYDGANFYLSPTDGTRKTISFTDHNHSGVYQTPLTFSTGLTDTAGTLTVDLSTGKSGGLTVKGGTGSGENLTLSSTTHGTKGKILFGTSGYDEVNNRLGIGTNAPSVTLDINGQIKTSTSLVIKDQVLQKLSGTSSTSGTIDGLYWGRTKLASDVFDESLYNFGEKWVARDSSRSWRGIAMSADGSRQTALEINGNIYASNDYGKTWTAKDQPRSWYHVAMSADGSRQTAVVDNGQIYTSSDYGDTWSAKDSDRSWRDVVVSADGSRQTAVVNSGQIYVSADYGETWSAKDNIRAWQSVAMSADGSRQTAVVSNGQIYVSADYGETWGAEDSNRLWTSVTMSADGSRQTAVADNNQIYVSSDYGNTWVAKDSGRDWVDVAMSADGSRQIAIASGGTLSPDRIYTSTNYGDTWTQTSTIGAWFDVAMSVDGSYASATVLSGYIYTSHTEKRSFLANVGIGFSTAPTAVLHLKAGTATAGTAPLKFTAGTNLGTAEAGVMEYDGANFYLSPTDGTRKTVAFTDHNHDGSYQTALIFSTGLTNSSGTLTVDLSTGKSGGLTVKGGTDSGENLTLSSTNHGTKGKILFGTSAYDEVNNKLGIGSNSPNGKLDIIGAPAGTANYGLTNIGATTALFDGASTGHFVGIAQGTQLAINAANGFSGNLIDFQVAGTSRFKIAANGTISAGLDGHITIAPSGTGDIKLVTDSDTDLFIGDGGSTNYSKFDANGVQSFAGAARPYSEIFLTPNEAIVPASNGCTKSSVTAGSGSPAINYLTNDCDASTDESAFWQFKIPQNYVNATNIQVDVYWIANDTTGAAIFDAGYAAVADDENWDAVNLTNVAGSNVTTADTAYKVNTSTITLTAPSIAADDLVSLRILRDADNVADTLIVDAKIIKVRIKFLVNS